MEQHQMQERQKLQLKVALKMAEALEREARRIVEQPPPFRPEKAIGAGDQVNELVQWVQQELNIRLPIVPLPNDPDPFTLSLTATQLVGALRLLVGEEVGEEELEKPKERRRAEREPVIRIRDQKSPVEFSEVVITSAEELAELLRTGLPEWIKQIIVKATGAAQKAVEEATHKAPKAMEVGEEKEAVTVRLGERLSERLESLEELLEEATEELEEVEEELQEAVEEGELTEERKAQLEAKRRQIKERIREAMQSLQQALGEKVRLRALEAD